MTWFLFFVLCTATPNGCMCEQNLITQTKTEVTCHALAAAMPPTEGVLECVLTEDDDVEQTASQATR